MSVEKLGIMDIGTNSVRMIIIEVGEDNIKILQRAIKVTRLGENFSEKKILMPAAVKRTIDAIKEFRYLALRNNVVSIVVVATSAVREAENRSVFLSEVAKTTGLKIRVLSGEEEAGLSCRGALISLDKKTDDFIVFDIGGGSTEVAWKENNCLVAKSFPVGVVKLQEKFNLDDNFSEKKLYDADKYLGEIFKDLINTRKVNYSVGVGGTVTSLSAVRQGLIEYDPRLVHGSVLSLTDIDSLKKLFIGTPLEKRRLIPGLMPERADVIVAGILIVNTLMIKMSLNSFLVSEGDLMLGLIAREEHRLVYDLS